MTSEEPPKVEIIPASATGEYLLERSAMADALALLDEHLRATSFSILNLPRIRLASGGAVNFRVETTEGEDTPKRLVGIITAARQARVYWKSSAVSGRPPDCTSTDGFVGIGDPGGNCKDCPYARFGSAVSADGSAGGGQACKDIRQVLFLTADQLLPHLLNISPTSIKAFNSYTLGLLSSKIPYWAVITELALERATSEGGKPYAKILFRRQNRLNPAEQQLFRPYHERMKQLLIPAEVDATAYEVDEEPGRTVQLRPANPGAPPPPDNPDIPF